MSALHRVSGSNARRRSQHFRRFFQFLSISLCKTSQGPGRTEQETWIVGLNGRLDIYCLTQSGSFY